MQPDEPTVRIPVRISSEGEPEFFYGGPLPPMLPGTIGDLTVPEYAVQDQGFLDLLRRSDTKEMFPADTVLFVSLSHRYTEDQVGKDNDYLLRVRERTPDTHGHQAWLTGNERLPLLPHGLWTPIILRESLILHLRGTKAGELFGCKCYLPALEVEAGSLNEAYTQLSTAYETRRRSHTGNVFDKVYFLNGKAQCWQPLDVRRTMIEAGAEKELIANHQPCWYWREGSEAPWACSETAQNGSTTIHMLTASGQLRASHFFGCHEKAERWLDDEGFQLLTGSQDHPMPRPPEPPYRKPNGSEIAIKPDWNRGRSSKLSLLP